MYFFVKIFFHYIITITGEKININRAFLTDKPKNIKIFYICVKNHQLIFTFENKSSIIKMALAVKDSIYREKEVENHGFQVLHAKGA